MPFIPLNHYQQLKADNEKLKAEIEGLRWEPHMRPFLEAFSKNILLLYTYAMPRKNWPRMIEEAFHYAATQAPVAARHWSDLKTDVDAKMAATPEEPVQ